jgi:hypothetical protein
MSDQQNEDQNENEDERPCLHCLIVETIDSFLVDYPLAPNEPEAFDTEEVITALAKTVAELTSSQDNAGRQNMIEQLMREVMNYDAEYREQDKLGVPASGARH